MTSVPKIQPKLTTVLAQVLVCLGCCCGRTDCGKPEVPIDWLKAEWKQRRLARHVHLTISGCLGPCELVNVVGVLTGDGSTFLGRLSQRGDYEALVEWAEAVNRAGELLPLPAHFRGHEVERFALAPDAVPA